MIKKYDKYINGCGIDKCNLKIPLRRKGNNLYYKIYIINTPPIRIINDRLFVGLGYRLNLTAPLNFKCRTK